MPGLESMINEALQEYEKNIRPFLTRNIYNIGPRLDELIGKLDEIMEQAGPCLVQRRIGFFLVHLFDLKIQLEGKGAPKIKIEEFVEEKLLRLAEKVADIKRLDFFTERREEKRFVVTA